MTRLGILAVAFAAGVVMAHVDSVAGMASVALWAAALVWCAARFGARGPLWLLVFALAGAARMSIHEIDHDINDPVVAPAALPAGALADDRTLDVVRGVVRGPMEETRTRRRFVVDADAPADVRVLVSMERGPGHDEAAAILPGDRVEAWGLLRTPRGYRVPGAADLARIIRGQGGDITMAGHSVEILAPGAVWSPWRPAVQMHRLSSAKIASRGGDTYGNAVVRAMVTGDRSGLDLAVTGHFRDAGVAHVLAVSGLHLAVVSLFIFSCVRRLWAAIPQLASRIEPGLAAALIAAPGALVYTMMTGARTSTLRALLVVTVMLLGVALARRARLVDALGLAALILLMHRPALVFDASFQLSFAATATLALFLRNVFAAGRHDDPGRDHDRALGRLGSLLDRVWQLLCASFWATLATAPFTALWFGVVAPAGLVANLVAVPMTELCIVPLGLAGCALSALWPAGGGLLLDVTIWLAGWMHNVIATMAGQVPPVRVFPPTAWELGGAALIWLGALLAVRRACSRRVWLVVIFLGLSAVLASFCITTRWLPAQRRDVRITFIDVGQGDAAVIEMPGGRVWMIDGGGMPFVPDDLPADERARRARAPGQHAVAKFLAWRRIARIDVLIVSHPHPDHYEGVYAVAEAVDIGAVWVARGYPRSPPTYQPLIDQLAARGTRVVHPRLDEPWRAGPVTVTVLAPRYLDGVATADPVSGINDNSLVVRIEAFGRSVLFTGDVELEGEELLVARYGSDLRADLVKVPHHGSPTSSTAPFVAATSPLAAIISCGVANRFGFPAAAVMTRWRRAGARIFRIDRAGSVTATIAPDGHLRVRGMAPP